MLPHKSINKVGIKLVLFGVIDLTVCMIAIKLFSCTIPEHTATSSRAAYLIYLPASPDSFTVHLGTFSILLHVRLLR